MNTIKRRSRTRWIVHAIHNPYRTLGIMEQLSLIQDGFRALEQPRIESTLPNRIAVIPDDVCRKATARERIQDGQISPFLNTTCPRESNDPFRKNRSDHNELGIFVWELENSFIEVTFTNDIYFNLIVNIFLQVKVVGMRVDRVFFEVHSLSSDHLLSTLWNRSQL